MVGQDMTFGQLQTELDAQLPQYPAYLLPESSKYRLLTVLGDYHDVVTAIPPHVSLAFPLSHWLSLSEPGGLGLEEPFSCTNLNPGSVEPLRVTPPEAVVYLL
jgi:hypothetical protein